MWINHHEPASSLHILVDQVGQEGRLSSTRFPEYPHMPQTISLCDPNLRASTVIDILTQYAQYCIVS